MPALCHNLHVSAMLPQLIPKLFDSSTFTAVLLMPATRLFGTALAATNIGTLASCCKTHNVRGARGAAHALWCGCSCKAQRRMQS